MLAGLVLAAYAQVIRFDFINLDDAQYVKSNPAVTAGLSLAGVKYAFTHAVAGNWHPVTVLSHMIDCHFFGIRPGFHHATSLLFHVANTVLVFLVLLKLTTQGEPLKAKLRAQGVKCPNDQPSTINYQQSLCLCGFVAALFGLHPLHVESVAWISERKDVLSAFFFLLTLGTYAQYVRSKGTNALPTPAGTRSTLAAPPFTLLPPRSTVFYCLALVFFALGLLSKAMLVTVPFVLLLLDFWPLKRVSKVKWPEAQSCAGSPTGLRTAGCGARTILVEKIPFFILSGALCMVTFLIQKSSGAVVSLENFSIPARIANAFASCARYIVKTIWPHSLAVIYPYQTPNGIVVAMAALLLAAISILAVWSVRNRPHIFVGWFFFIGMLVPVSGLVQAGSQAMADRYTYLPLLGIFIAAAWSVVGISPRFTKPAFALAGATVTALTVATASQVRYWKDSESLFTHALIATGHNSQANYFLGAICDSRGDQDGALLHFEQAVQENAANVRARCGLGYIYANQGKLQLAEQQYQSALLVQPNLAKAQFGLAEVLLRENRSDQAIEHYQKALESGADIPEAHYALAGLLAQRNDRRGALVHLRQAVRLAPDWPLALNDLAWRLATVSEADLRDGAEAARLATRAVSLTAGKNPMTLDTLAAAYAETGRFNEALQTAQSAIEKANAVGQTNIAAEIGAHLAFYQSGKALRE